MSDRSVEANEASEEMRRQIAELREQNAALVRACKRFAPVLDWLKACADGTLGHSLAEQLQPVMDAAIAKAEGRKVER